MPFSTVNCLMASLYTAETALSRLNQRSLERVFAVNAFGPILVSKVGRCVDCSCTSAAVHGIYTL